MMRIVWAALSVTMLWTAYPGENGKMLAVFLSPGSLEMDTSNIGASAPSQSTLFSSFQQGASALPINQSSAQGTAQ